MRNAITIVQIILGVSLTIVILMQNRSSGVGASWGGSSMSYHSKRGIEKILMRMTIILAVLFIGFSIGAVLLPA